MGLWAVVPSIRVAEAFRTPSATTSRHWVIHTPDSLEITVADSGELLDLTIDKIHYR